TGATVTMTAMSSDQTNRVSVVTATCTSCAASPATSQINVVGASITLANSGSSSLSIGGGSATLTATVKNFAGVGIADVDVSFAATDPLVLGLDVASAKTNSSGVAQVVVSGLSAGNAMVNVTALGNAKSQSYSSAAATAVLAITSPTNQSLLKTTDTATIVVTAPTTANQVTFGTTLGRFGNGQSSQIVAKPAAFSAALTFTQAGTASVTVIDDLGNTANLVLYVSPPVANKILLNASQTTVPVSVANGTQSSLTLTARALFTDGTSDQAVANVPIQFSMTGGPNSGEFLSPALVISNSAGIAVATFTSGATASITNGITVTAAIPATTVTTGTLPSGNSASLTVGGQALSVAFGPASVLGESADKTLYVHAYSVQVTDANNNPVANQLVTLRMRPVAFSLGSPCNVTATYCSEDYNGNGSLDTGEDSVRVATTLATAANCPATAATVASLNPTIGDINFANNRTTDTFLTPSNSDAGSVPSTVTTDANGIAAFNLTYLKGSAFWNINRLTATVSSNGTETTKSVIFRLSPSATDYEPDVVTVDPTTGIVTTTLGFCYLPASPYSY
ncbi:MAG: hypothetical protein PHH58_04940, partial [Rhodoferax sp.]|nr:hypothetical protein [Rhodoferax sp.]